MFAKKPRNNPVIVGSRPRTEVPISPAMEYLGDKLSVAQSQVTGWMGNVRRSLQGALSFVSSSVERGGGGGGGDEGSGFKRAASLRSLASRSRESFRRLSLRSQRLSLRRHPPSPATPTTVSKISSHTPSPSHSLQCGCPTAINHCLFSVGE